MWHSHLLYIKTFIRPVAKDTQRRSGDWGKERTPSFRVESGAWTSNEFLHVCLRVHGCVLRDVSAEVIASLQASPWGAVVHPALPSRASADAC